jgi:hypothetical protein
MAAQERSILEGPADTRIKHIGEISVRDRKFTSKLTKNECVSEFQKGFLNYKPDFSKFAVRLQRMEITHKTSSKHNVLVCNGGKETLNSNWGASVFCLEDHAK